MLVEVRNTPGRGTVRLLLETWIYSEPNLSTACVRHTWTTWDHRKETQELGIPFPRLAGAQVHFLFFWSYLAENNGFPPCEVPEVQKALPTYFLLQTKPSFGCELGMHTSRQQHENFRAGNGSRVPLSSAPPL